MSNPVASKIMVIRHAEKPISGSNGVEQNGTKDGRSLIIQGWQRAGALASFFAPSDGHFTNAAIATPQYIFASNFTSPSDEDTLARPELNTLDDDDSSDESLTKRPQETIWPLAAKLGSTVTTNYQYYIERDEAAVATAAMACAGIVLIAWEHLNIPNIVSHFPITPNTPAPTNSWPNEFDVVWVFGLDPNHAGTYLWQQLYQCLLAGDKKPGGVGG